MGISGAKSGPNSVKGEFMEQNEARRFVEDGVGIGTKTSLAQELEKARERMRCECATLAENKRVLEYLEKGGDPLNFKHEDYVSPSVQSTSLKCNEKKRKDADANDDETGKKEENKKKKEAEE